jgi:hypothetical protein
MTLTFTQPYEDLSNVLHHADAAAGNIVATDKAIGILNDALARRSNYERILLKAAAGAGKSHALKRMVEHALDHEACKRVAVVAFANKQVFPLAEELGAKLGKQKVCLLVARDRYEDVPESTKAKATVVTSAKDIPPRTGVVVATSHRVGGFAMNDLRKHLSPAHNGEQLFDVLFVDEAWQLPLHRYRDVERLAPIAVGVGDVGQLPPLDPGQNPWRGDINYNPYRAWPTAYENDGRTWSTALPAVWRPSAAQLPLWRAFYRDWESLHCVAAPGDREVVVRGLRGPSAQVWGQVASGRPALVEVAGLPDPEAPDIDQPLLEVVEGWLDQLLRRGFSLRSRRCDDKGKPKDWAEVSTSRPRGDRLIAVLATRNQAVDDATEMVERLSSRHRLADGVIVASTVDSWQGQTNGITIAFHPLSGASQLDEFNSAFGRLAVTCTRATHGLLMVSRAGLSDLLKEAPARPGTPFGEPGTRQLPRQTHQRILDVFARTTLSVG